MFRTKPNLWFFLITGIIPSLLASLANWQPGNFGAHIEQISSGLLGSTIFILLPCLLTMYLFKDILPKFPGKKNRIAILLYLPVTITAYMAIYFLWSSKLDHARGSSTDALVMILPVFYGLPVLGVMYAAMNVILNRNKKKVS